MRILVGSFGVLVMMMIAAPSSAQEVDPPLDDDPLEEPALPDAPPPAIGAPGDVVDSVGTTVSPERMRTLSRGTGELRAEAGQSYLRLMALRDRLFGSSDTGTIRVVQVNAVGLFYRLVEVTYAIDGEAVHHDRDENGRLGQGTVEVHEGLLSPGEHRLSIVLRYVGDGGPLIRYLEGFAFQVRSSHTFAVNAGSRTVLTLHTFDRGPEVPYEQRLGLRMERSISALHDRHLETER